MVDQLEDSKTVPSAKSWSLGSAFAKLPGFLEKYALVGLLIILVLYFSVSAVTSDYFLSSANLQNIFANQAVVGLVALGMVIPMVAGYFDLSVPASAGLSHLTVAALLSVYGTPVWLALVAGVVAAGLVGFVNAFIISVLRLNAIIATLGTYILLGGLLLAYTGGTTINQGIPLGLGAWGSGRWAGDSAAVLAVDRTCSGALVCPRAHTVRAQARGNRVQRGGGEARRHQCPPVGHD